MSLRLHPNFTNQHVGDCFLLAISGGRDSVALLHILLENGFTNLILCHLNHCLRGDESERDADFVRALGEKLQLITEVGIADVECRMREKNESLELAARNARHAFFADCARKHECGQVLLAHHMDDHAETILFNLLRGSSTLKGVPFSSKHIIGQQRLVFMRPLIDVRRSSIDKYITEHSIDYCEDSSNEDLAPARNRLRHEVFPLLESIMRREVTPTLCRASAQLEGQDNAVREYLLGLDLEDPQGRLFLPKLLGLHTSFQKTAIFEYLKKHDVKNINSEMVERCCDLLMNDQIAKVNLTEGRYLRRREKRLFIEATKKS